MTGHPAPLDGEAEAATIRLLTAGWTAESAQDFVSGLERRAAITRQLAIMRSALACIVGFVVPAWLLLIGPEYDSTSGLLYSGALVANAAIAAWTWARARQLMPIPSSPSGVGTTHEAWLAASLQSSARLGKVTAISDRIRLLMLLAAASSLAAMSGSLLFD